MTAQDRAIPATRGKGRYLASSMLTAMLWLGSPAIANAQDAPASPTSNPDLAASPDVVSGSGGPADNLGDILVTGSRVSASGFNAPTPVTVVSGATLDKFQATNVADILLHIPAVKSTFNPASTGFRTQLPGANFVDLYGLGSNRTLVLINGNRVVPQAPAASSGSALAVDLNIIPSLMIDHVDVVTGGASAQWGSDAIAGVVNVILKSRYNGIMIKAQSGLSQEGDNAMYRVGAVAGTSFADDRGNIVAGIDWAKSKGLGDVYSRDWSRKLINIVSNTAFATNGRPANLTLPGVVAKSTAYGVIVGPANFSLNNRQILANGALAPFTLGQFPGLFTMAGGDANAPSFIANNNLINPYERVNGYARAQYEFSPAITVFAEGSYGQVKASNIVNPPRALNQVISIDNAFLPANIRTAMQAANITSFTFNRQNYDLAGANQVANGIAEGRMRVARLVGGFKGDLGGSLNWDAHYSWGQSKYRNVTRNNADKTKFAFSVDSIRLANGTAVCRATQPGPAFNAAAAGCVPVDLLNGANRITPEASAYILYSPTQTSNYKQNNAAVNLRGQPFETWAGPVAFAAGLEYRKESQVVVVDAVSDAGNYLLNNATSLRGSFDVKEGYIEAVVPLAKDSPFARSLEIDAAVRYADYSSAGSATTWKAGINYEPTEGVRFRASRSRDLRAPSIFELFSKGSINQNTVIVRGSTANIPVNNSVGNPNLRPEIANTFTGGTVLRPGFLPGLQVSVDYYKIKMKDTIIAVASSNSANLCNTGDTFFCSKFTFNAAGVATSLTTPVLNAGFVNVDGIDAVLAYKTGLGSMPGSLSFDFDLTYVRHVKVNLGAGSPTIERSGENGGSNNFALPRSRFTASTTYSVGPVDLTARVDFISAGTVDNSYNQSPSTTIDDNHVPAVAYLSMYGAINVTDRFQLFGSVQNLLDKDPPVVPVTGLFQQSNGVYYDFVGRRFQAGVSVKF